MTFRTTTLTATLALVLGAGTALAQQETVITVPLGETATAPQAQGGTTFTATPNTDGTAEVATPSGEAPQQATGTLLSPAETVVEGEQPAQAPADAAATAPATESATAPAAAEAPAADTAAAPEAADAPAADTAAAPAAAEAPAADTAATTPAAAPDADTAAAPDADADAQPADTATATAPAPEATAEAGANASSDDPAASVEGDVAVTTGDSEAPVEGEADAALGTVSEADTEAQVAEAENQASRTAGENVAEGVDQAAAEAPAAAHVQHVTDVAFPFEGPFGKYDQFQLQRGLQVYTEVCASCHGMRYVPLRTLSDANGPGLPADQVRAYAEALSIVDPETGEERPRLPTDNFPIVTGEGMGPDLSLMAKARAGFHGPYGTGISQLFNGIGGPEYIYSVLTGYTDETKDEAGSTFYENAAFAGGWIKMPPPLSEDLVTYADGTPATVENMATDVSAFLMWAAEPKMMERKHTGFVAVIFLIVLSVLLYLTNKRLWWPVKHGRED